MTMAICSVVRQYIRDFYQIQLTGLQPILLSPFSNKF